MNLTNQAVHQKGQHRPKHGRIVFPPFEPSETLRLITLAAQKGSDSDFRRWIQRQRSCLTGKFAEYGEDGKGRNPACHVRRGGSSGTGYKAPFACVPMTHQEHALQSNRGEVAVLTRYLGGSWTVESAKAWFDAKRIDYLKAWINDAIIIF